MRHIVVWSIDSYRSLQQIWDAAGDRESVAHAIDEIHDELETDAHQKGESREGGLRVLFASPLGIVFWANDRTSEVVIRAVWTFRARTGQ